jgi:hypothetical protein
MIRGEFRGAAMQAYLPAIILFVALALGLFAMPNIRRYRRKLRRRWHKVKHER